MKGLFSLLALLAILYFVSKGCSSSDVDTDKSKVFNPDNERRSAYVEAKMFIESKLKSPSTADFATPNMEADVRYKADSTFIVRSYVDAKNSFGVPLRTPWMVVLKRNNTTGGHDYDIMDYKIYQK